MARPDRVLVFLLVLLVAPLGPAAHAELPAEVKRALASRDYGSALAWLEAHPGDPEAEYELGRLYRLGKGVPRDEDQALAHFRLAAEAGVEEAQYLLGKHYERAGDLAAATHWIGQASEGGHRRASLWVMPGETESPLNLAALISRDRPIPAGGLSAVQANTADTAGTTPLMLAAEVGATQWLEALLASGARTDAADHHGATALHVAVMADERTAVETLLGAGANPNAANREGNTALHLAAASSSPEIAEVLLAARADPHLENAAGWSASSLASRAGNLEMDALFGLRNVQKDSKLTDTDGAALPQLVTDAALRGDLSRLDALLANEQLDPGAEQLMRLPHALAEAGQADALDRLLRAGVPVSVSDVRGRTALLVAALSNCLECVDKLVAHGAQLEAADSLSRTALILASREGHAGLVGVLLRQGAASDATDKSGRNALWWAVSEKHEATARILLEARAPARQDHEGLNPLHLAASTDSSTLIPALAERVAVNAETGDGNTALLLSAHVGAVSSLRVLIELNANVNYRNGLGDTALIMATRASHLDAARALLDAGANPDARNERFESAVSIAESRGDREWITLLQSADRGVLDLLGTR